MSVLKSALAISLAAASLAVIAATAADAQTRYYRYMPQSYRYMLQPTNEWPIYSPTPFSREADENFTQP